MVLAQLGPFDQIAVREIARLRDAAERSDEDVIVFEVAETPLNFVYVPVEVFHGHLVERIGYRPLEQRPHALDRVRVNIADHRFLAEWFTVS